MFSVHKGSFNRVRVDTPFISRNKLPENNTTPFFGGGVDRVWKQQYGRTCCCSANMLYAPAVRSTPLVPSRSVTKFIINSISIIFIITYSYLYYYLSCHPTMYSMIFNMDHSQISRNYYYYCYYYYSSCRSTMYHMIFNMDHS